MKKKQAKITTRPRHIHHLSPSPPKSTSALNPLQIGATSFTPIIANDSGPGHQPRLTYPSSFNSACKGPASRNSGNHADRGGSDNWSCSTVGTRPHRLGRSTSGRLLGSYPGLCGWERKMQGQYIYLFHMVLGNQWVSVWGTGRKGRGGFWWEFSKGNAP